ncbi:hypothetical protein [Xanthocytophaga agilis]|uniref:Pyrrolo-quinoline quinone n=1 Tax=Xanthocytophaga agilis TaxID=3048010 RepID=A0AAE3UGM4_9BACT|nr:hypothetical protein [Xanthocytophaga agilis]MDJ1501738.1 hypothetical protein [Xanthocytophaga agilis]
MRELQNAIIYDDKIYCNTIDVRGNKNFLYCLNPVNGLVVWRAPVTEYATQPVFLCDDVIIYCSFMGNISAFNKQGKVIWQAKFNSSYGGHWVDTTHSTLLVKTVYWKDVVTYAIKSGKVLSEVKSDSLQKVIAENSKNAYPMPKKQYRFERMGRKYVLTCEPEERRGYKKEYKIDIQKHRL